MAQAAYGKLASRPLQPRAEFAEPPRLTETRMTLVRPDVQVPLMERIYRVPSYAQAAPGQAESFETLAQIMGGDQTATLYRVLVEEKKLATDAGASYDGFARDAGAAWLILQPPRPPASGTHLIEFFGAVADAVDCPVGIQNAPEFLGIGLSTADLLALHEAHPNVQVVKAESTALTVAGVVADPS